MTVVCTETPVDLSTQGILQDWTSKIYSELNNSVLPAFRTIKFPSNFRFAKHYDDDDDDEDDDDGGGGGGCCCCGGGAVVMMGFSSM